HAFHYADQHVCHRCDRCMTQCPSRLERPLGCGLRGLAHVATGLARRLNDTAHGTQRHSGHIGPHLRAPSYHAFDGLMGHAQHIASHVTPSQHRPFGDAFGTYNESYTHLFGCLERACDDIVDHCHTVAGHLPGSFQGLRDRTAHKIDNLCLNLIETFETRHDPLFDRSASAAD